MNGNQAFVTTQTKNQVWSSGLSEPEYFWMEKISQYLHKGKINSRNINEGNLTMIKCHCLSRSGVKQAACCDNDQF